MAQNLVLNILARDKTKQAFNGIRAGLTNLRSAVFSVQSALIGIGGGLVVRSLLKTGMEVENLAVRFNFLFGNAKEGAKAFQNLTKFAAKVPFSLEEISQASGNLAVVAKDAEDLTRILKITGNVASVTGLDFALTATQIQRAFSGGIAAADVFRERGVRALLGFKMGATVSVEETIEAFEKTFGENGRFAKATEVLSTTMTGTLSMLGDKLFKFKTETNQAGFFDFVKQGLADINNIMEANEAVLNNLAIRISEFMIKTVKNVLIGGAVLMDTLKPVFKLVGVAMEGIIQSVKALPSGIRELGIIGFLMLGGKGKLLVVLIMSTIDIIRSALGTVLETYANLMDKVNAGMRTLKLISQETFEANLLTFDKMFATAQKLKTPLKAIKQTGEDSADSWGEAETAIRNFLTNLEINAKISKAQYNEMMSILEASKEEAEKMGVSLQKIRETTLKEIAQRILVDVLAFTIQIVIQEAIRSAFKKDQVKSEEKVTHELKKQTKEIKKQAAIKAVGSFFGIPMMNTGGAVSKGKPVVVGERGAEMFIPNSSGQITQSARGTGGGTVNVNFNIEAIDSNSFNSVLVENRGIITSIINNALNEKGKRELI